MGWPAKLVLVRHGESEGNLMTVEERAKFETSTHAYRLTPRGEKQAFITGQFLRDKFSRFDVYYASYYQRALETMRVMYPEAKIYEDPRLAEAQRGVYHIMTHDEIAARFPQELVRKLREGLYHYRPWGGENWADIELRIHSFLGTLTRDYEGQKVLIVVHGHWLILFQRLIEHFSIEEALARYKNNQNDGIENASVTYYESREIKGKSRLVLIEKNIVPWQGKI